MKRIRVDNELAGDGVEEFRNSTVRQVLLPPTGATGCGSGAAQVRVGRVSVPLYQAKAEMFRVLGHPVRIRVLELLQGGPRPVRDLLAEIDVEPSNLSQQLAVLRRSGVVVSFRSDGL